MRKQKIAIIGGGPAGMMAAIQAKQKDNEVILFEKNNRLGVKLLITGKGRCNLTNSEKDIRKFIQVFGQNGKFLFSTFSKFFNQDLLEFFEKRGLGFNCERGGRYFPKSNLSLDVLNVLKSYLKERGIIVKNNKRLQNIEIKSTKFNLQFYGSEFRADKVIIATGGKSYPKTGSNGEVFDIIKKLGHQIIDLKPSLVPILLSEKEVNNLEGLSLKNVEAKIIKDDKVIASRFGEMIFTSRGVSGPIILSLSKYICRQNVSKLILGIDFKPALSLEQLTQRIRREMNKRNIIYQNLLKLLLPNKIIPLFLARGVIDAQQQIKHLNKKQIKELSQLLKDFRFKISALENFDHAIVTAGGVSLKEINPRIMESKLIPGLFFAGEVLDLDAETGGYNLQAAFSTGYIAGTSSSL